jgi:hypothetical protein
MNVSPIPVCSYEYYLTTLQFYNNNIVSMYFYICFLLSVVLIHNYLKSHTCLILECKP